MEMRLKKELTIDNVCDFCDLLTAIGIEDMINEFDKNGIRKLVENKKDEKAIGEAVIMKIVPLIIRKIGKVRNENYTFLAGCCELEDGTAANVDDVRKMSLTKLIKLLKEFFARAELQDFLSEVLELKAMEQGDLKSCSIAGMVSRTGI